jgi:hypothetical protein
MLAPAVPGQLDPPIPQRLLTHAIGNHVRSAWEWA